MCAAEFVDLHLTRQCAVIAVRCKSQHLDGVRSSLGTCDLLQQRSRYCENCRIFPPDAERLKIVYGFRADDNAQLIVGSGWSSGRSEGLKHVLSFQ